MKKRISLIILLILAFGVAFLAFYPPQRNQSEKKIILSQNKIESPSPVPTAADGQPKKIWPPLDRAGERVTKKMFGLLITPKNSPIQPEKFSGYHTGTDFEIFPEELEIQVPVKAVCSGKLLTKKSATGYGGVAVESCDLDGQPITVVYGHLNLDSITAKIGDQIIGGEAIGVLGRGYSVETGGERKHLHLGFHKGSSINILGYVKKQAELSDWLDTCLYVCD